MVSGPHPLTLTLYALRLLAQGRPVRPAQLAAAAGWPRAQVETVLHGFTATEWDTRGRLIGLGLTLRPTPHRFVIDQRVLFTWCAMDTLLFPVILGSRVQVHSHCASTSASITFTVSPDGTNDLAPASTVVTEIRPSGAVADLRSTVCDQGQFFTKRRAAIRWRAEHPGGQVMPLASAFDAARARVTRLGWDTTGAPP
ncbi:MAG: organomercurial lyase MerB [Nocardioidaceae bacterium]